ALVRSPTARARPPKGSPASDAVRAAVAPARGRGARRSRTRVPLPARAGPGGRLRLAARGQAARGPPSGRRGAREPPLRLARGGLRPARAALLGGGGAGTRDRVPAQGGGRRACDLR